MQKQNVAFDIDDTLLVPRVVGISDRETPNYKNIALLKWFQNNGYNIILWSGSGVDWARTWGEKFGLQPFEVRVKQKSDDVLIAFDDCVVDLAQVNIKVKRINNSISRKEWNETKGKQKHAEAD